MAGYPKCFHYGSALSHKSQNMAKDSILHRHSKKRATAAVVAEIPFTSFSIPVIWSFRWTKNGSRKVFGKGEGIDCPVDVILHVCYFSQTVYLPLKSNRMIMIRFWTEYWWRQKYSSCDIYMIKPVPFCWISMYMFFLINFKDIWTDLQWNSVWSMTTFSVTKTTPSLQQQMVVNKGQVTLKNCKTF